MPWSQGGGAIGDILLPSGAPPPLVCTYVNNYGVAPSPNDVWGAFEGTFGQYNASPNPPPPTQTILQGLASFYGTANCCNDPTRFGLSAAVFAACTVEARWAFDMAQAPGGSPYVCRAMLIGSGFGLTTIRLSWSDDGIAWTDVAVLPYGNPPASIAVANLRHRYWSLHSGPYAHPGGYFSGEDMSGFLLWGAS